MTTAESQTILRPLATSWGSPKKPVPDWVATQHKVFLRWTNTYLNSHNIEPIQDLTTDLASGVKLIELLEIIGNESLGKYNRNPRLRIQKVENLNTAMDFIKHRGIMLHNIGAEDIIDGNLKLILGLLWILILRFTISEINEEGISAKEGLLLWCQRKTAHYEGVDVRDFSKSWANGLAFCALIDAHRPDLLDYDLLSKDDPRGNVALALQIASEQIGIPRILDVEDLCNVKIPDERSVMTYVAYWFHAFSELDKIETAGRRIEKFVDTSISSISMQHTFERRMKDLLENIASFKASWSNAEFAGTYKDTKIQAEEFVKYKKTVKRDWIAEKSELATLLSNIRTKLATYELKDYRPPSGMRLADLEDAWKDLLRSEAQRSSAINGAMRDVKEKLRSHFASVANKLAEDIDYISLKISELNGELETQLEEITNISDRMKPLDEHIHQLKDLDMKCVEANVEENDYTVYSFSELEYELGLAKQSVLRKLAFIENQMVARSTTKLTPIQLEEFESVFRYFDKGHRNGLTENEFSGALASLGLVYDEEEMHEMFITSSKGGSIVYFEQFIKFMVEVTEDQNTAIQVYKSFEDIANGKPYITEMDLKSSYVSDETIEKLKSTMPKVKSGQGYDYVGFMTGLMAK